MLSLDSLPCLVAQCHSATVKFSKTQTVTHRRLQAVTDCGLKRQWDLLRPGNNVDHALKSYLTNAYVKHHIMMNPDKLEKMPSTNTSFTGLRKNCCGSPWQQIT